MGTVLFEMISGKTPFHGENHLDLLRNKRRYSVSYAVDKLLNNSALGLPLCVPIFNVRSWKSLNAIVFQANSIF